MKIKSHEQYDEFLLEIFDKIVDNLKDEAYDIERIENDFFSDLDNLLEKYFIIPDYQNYN